MEEYLKAITDPKGQQETARSECTESIVTTFDYV